MTLIQSILMGIVQGVTEFLPVSSSGHLVLVPYLLGWDLHSENMFFFFVLVQVASLVGVFAYFLMDILAILKAFVGGILSKTPFEDADSRLGWYIIVATIPAGIIGLILKNAVEAAFSSPVATGVFLCATAALLFIAERTGRRERDIEKLSWQDALWIGVFQALAIFPGVSRSGATITGGMLRNLNRPVAAHFAFLMSIPVMLAAGLLTILDLSWSATLSQELPVFAAGFLVSSITSYLAIKWLLNFLKGHSLYPFAVYCFLLGLLVMGVFIL